MEFHFDRQIRLSLESQYKSLYSWSLQECSRSGETLGRDVIPWFYTLNFNASDLRHVRRYQLDQEWGSGARTARTGPAEFLEALVASLHVASNDDPDELSDEVTLSMLGTEREIKSITLRIAPLANEDEPERCSIWGCVSYTSEHDFRYVTEDDTLQVHVAVRPSRFKQLTEHMRTRANASLEVSLAHVAGFYAEWTPSMSTSSVKVLTQDEEHVVQLPEGTAFLLPRLGEVGEFGLTLVSGRKLRERAAMIASDSERSPDSRERSNEHVADPAASAGRHRGDHLEALLQQRDFYDLDRVQEQLQRNHRAMIGLRVPLWAIVALLIFMWLTS